MSKIKVNPFTTLLLASLFCLSLFLPLYVLAQTEQLAFTIQHNSGRFSWKLGSEYESKGKYAITEFIREGDDINNWKELVTIQNLVPPIAAKTPESFYQGIRELMERDCPRLSTWKIIAKDKESIIYERQAKPCKNFTNEHEIAKIIYGNYNIFRVSYTAKVYQMSAMQRSEWVQNISKARIIRQ